VVTVKVALVCPAGTVTLAGTVAAAVLLLEIETRTPPLGAGALSATLPVEKDPPMTPAGFSESEVRVGPGGGCGVTVSDAVWVTPAKVAEMMTEVEAVTGEVVTLKTAVAAPAAPAGTVTLAGTVVKVVLLLDRETTAPPLGAGALNVRLPVEGDPPLTLVGFNLNEESVAEPDGPDGPDGEDTTVSPQEEKHSETAMSPAAAIASGRWRGVCPKRLRLVQTSSQVAQVRSHTERTSTFHGSGLIRTGTAGGEAARIIVCTITVAIPGLAPIGVTTTGVTTHVEAAGAPLQLITTG
jgi:hypothetical protein